MVTFGMRIEFYRAPRAAASSPTDAYVGAVTRHELTGRVLPRPGDYVHGLGPLVSQGLFGRGQVDHLEHVPVPEWDGGGTDPGVTVVIHAAWPSDVRGRSLLEEYAAKGWHIWFAEQDPTGDV